MLSPGTVLAGRYRIDSFLERSHLGDVYLAVDLNNEVPVTLKVLREDLAEDREFVREFQREVPALRALDHPHIARFYALEQEGVLAFTVAEYVPGLTLRRRLQDARGPLPLGEVTQILDQLAAALAFAHRQGVVHGGVQPASIMLDNGTAVLEDFSVAPALHRAGRAGTPAGNPAYMSLEQLQGQDVDEKTDVYGLGLVLYEMVTGQHPFRGGAGTGRNARGRVEDEDFTPPRDPREFNRALPAAAAAVILRALDRRPAARWPDTDSLAHAWLQALPDGRAAGGRPASAGVPAVAPPPAPAVPAPVSAAPASTVTRAGSTGASTFEWAPRRRWPWAAGALLLVAGLLLAALIAWLAVSRLAGSGQQAAAWASGNFGSPSSATATARALSRATPAPRATAAGPGTGSPVTATPQEGPYAVARVAANLRSGPGTDYPVVGGAAPGTQMPIVGRNSSRDWWQICCVNGSPAWISAELVTTGGPLQDVQVVENIPAPPAPTETPQPTATAERTTTPQPTATSVPTATPEPTETTRPTARPTDTPQPTPTASPTGTGVAQCPRPPAGAFARLSTVALAVSGCPAGPLVQTHFSHQFFERGQMIYRYDLRSIYVLYDDGAWGVYRDTYVEGQPWQEQEFNPPSGLKQPIKGFDRVWERPEVRDRLGWATRDEMGEIEGEVQDFQRGTAAWLNHPGYLIEYFLLLANGRWAQAAGS